MIIIWVPEPWSCPSALASSSLLSSAEMREGWNNLQGCWTDKLTFWGGIFCLLRFPHILILNFPARLLQRGVSSWLSVVKGVFEIGSESTWPLKTLQTPTFGYFWQRTDVIWRPGGPLHNGVRCQLPREQPEEFEPLLDVHWILWSLTSRWKIGRNS